MNQALAKTAEAERRAAALAEELQRVREPRPAATSRNEPQPVTGEPQFEQFADAPDPYTAYLQAWTRWDRAQGIAQAAPEWETAAGPAAARQDRSLERAHDRAKRRTPTLTTSCKMPILSAYRSAP